MYASNSPTLPATPQPDPPESLATPGNNSLQTPQPAWPLAVLAAAVSRTLRALPSYSRQTLASLHPAAESAPALLQQASAGHLASAPATSPMKHSAARWGNRRTAAAVRTKINIFRFASAPPPESRDHSSLSGMSSQSHPVPAKSSSRRPH